MLYLRGHGVWPSPLLFSVSAWLYGERGWRGCSGPTDLVSRGGRVRGREPGRLLEVEVLAVQPSPCQGDGSEVERHVTPSSSLKRSTFVLDGSSLVWGAPQSVITFRGLEVSPKWKFRAKLRQAGSRARSRRPNRTALVVSVFEGSWRSGQRHRRHVRPQDAERHKRVGLEHAHRMRHVPRSQPLRSHHRAGVRDGVQGLHGEFRSRALALLSGDSSFG